MHSTNEAMLETTRLRWPEIIRRHAFAELVNVRPEEARRPLPALSLFLVLGLRRTGWLTLPRVMTCRSEEQPPSQTLCQASQ